MRDYDSPCEDCQTTANETCQWCRASLCGACGDRHAAEHEHEDERAEWEREGAARGWN